MTGQGTETTGVDLDAVAGWIRGQDLPLTGTPAIERVGLGQSNLTYLVTDDDGHRWILRRPPLGRLLASAHDVVREARIVAALGQSAVPVPRVLGVSEEIGDAPLVLMEYVDGLVVDRTSLAESLPPQVRRALGLSLIKTLAAVHAVDLRTVGLHDLTTHRPYAPRQLKRWSIQWEQSRTRESLRLDELTRRLVAAVPPQHETTLVHGDFHLRNLITTPATGDVIAVLDWELSTLGDPLADIGSLLAYWAEPGEPTTPGFGASALEGFPTRAELTTAYLTETGRDPQALRFWHALGLWKVAVIAEGVLRRARDVPQNKAISGTPTIEDIDGLVERAHRVADTAGL